MSLDLDQTLIIYSLYLYVIVSGNKYCLNQMSIAILTLNRYSQLLNGNTPNCCMYSKFYFNFNSNLMTV